MMVNGVWGSVDLRLLWLEWGLLSISIFQERCSKALEQLIKEAAEEAETIKDSIKAEMLEQGIEELMAGTHIVRWTTTLFMMSVPACSISVRYICSNAVTVSVSGIIRMPVLVFGKPTVTPS